MIDAHSCDYHKYADDTEISKSAPPNDFTNVKTDIQACVIDVLSWMTSNKLKLNTDKTEVMAVGAPAHLQSINCHSADISGSNVPFQTTVQYLGVTLDQTLSLEQHISTVSRACYLEIRRIASIRPYLNQSAAATLMSALVLSHLDYCNSLFASVSQSQIDRLQRSQNHAARVVMKKRMRDHVTPLLRELHWLPVKLRSQFKIATLAYRHFDDSLPEYLKTTLVKRKYTKAIRSATVKRLDPPKKPNLKTIGGRSFSHVAPQVWNSLPANLRALPSLSEFRTQLKTYLFGQYFN